MSSPNNPLTNTYTLNPEEQAALDKLLGELNDAIARAPEGWTVQIDGVRTYPPGPARIHSFAFVDVTRTAPSGKSSIQRWGLTWNTAGQIERSAA